MIFNYNEDLEILLMLHEGAIFTFIILGMKNFPYAPCVSINQRRRREGGFESETFNGYLYLLEPGGKLVVAVCEIGWEVSERKMRWNFTGGKIVGVE
jgi:hypothetical protein